MDPEYWNQRFSAEEYAYGRVPNDFLASVAARIPAGEVLCLAAGQGRNAVHLATLGYQVTAVDGSSVGLERAQSLAAEKGVEIKTICADLTTFMIESSRWSGITSIFCHLPAIERADLHRRVVSGLKPDGVFILEAYTPRQLAFKTGGPPVVELLMELETLRSELGGLEFLHALEKEREIIEGTYHNGRSAVVQILARQRP